MLNNILAPQKALNKAFLKVKISRTQIELFKTNLQNLLNTINVKETEEFHKNLVADFLKNVYYNPHYFINTKGRNDLVIHNGNDAQNNVGVILEAKKPTNKSEMVKVDNLNAKALQELIFYFLQERIINKNLAIKHLIITNIYEWFIFEAQDFEKLFIENKDFLKQFTDFSGKNLTGTKTDYFYKNIAQPYIKEIESNLRFVYFDLRNYETWLENSNSEAENSLIPLFKTLAPENLLKLNIGNDSNSLNKAFYSELLHIIGLTEIKQGSKKLIQRQKEKERNSGSFLENAINEIEVLDKLSRVTNIGEFGDNKQEQLLAICLELVITWINRILFLKLLEAQLINYHKGDKAFSFLNSEKINNYNDINRLFFNVLACKLDERTGDFSEKFSHVPYLNSSLFEQTELEYETIFISHLREEKLPIFGNTVLKDNQGNKLTGSLNTLQYLFEFLNAYNFSSDSDDIIEEESKTLINASVLGLIFEKINGYKDGSFFTPGFITMYMCRQTIRRAVLEKFKEMKGWNCQNIDDLFNTIEDKKEANTIINSLKICDPAVGSGHFLVSALNEIIALKSELKILLDRQGKNLRDYQIEVIDDELIVTNDEGNLFKYNPNNIESQRVQEALFNEKQTIIENCLFGVDINPNSVKICQLRLWIELLKNAYYKKNPPLVRGDQQLETLPNLDINIKCGNSLISRFPLHTQLCLSSALKAAFINYKKAVKIYFNSQDRAQKREVDKLIKQIKSNFKTTLQGINPQKTKLRNLEDELYNLENHNLLFEETKTEKKAREKQVNKLTNEIYKLRVEIDDIESGKIYQNAFEWRFEFPEILNDNGDFIGFDVVIGNPPYGANLSENEKQYLQLKFINQDYQLDTYLLFIEQGLMIMKNQANFAYIVPNTWASNLKFKKIRSFILKNTKIQTIAHYKKAVFEEAVVDTQALFLTKSFDDNQQVEIKVYNTEKNFNIHFNSQVEWQLAAGESINIFLNSGQVFLKNKIETNSQKIGDLFNIVIGLKPYQKGKGKPKQTEFDVKNRIFDTTYQIDKTYKKLLRGSDINKYLKHWQENRWLKYGDNLAEPRYSANFDANEKIVIRQTGDTLIATIDDEQFICMNNLHVITNNKNDDLSLKYLLALINSKLLDYYHNMLNPEKGEALAEVKKENVAKLPIKIISSEKQNIFIEKVTQILALKQANPNTDTSELEREIDLLVYELYKLTDEEITIIERAK